VLADVIQDKPHRSGTDLGGKSVCRFAHNGSIFSRVGASDKPGAVHTAGEYARGEFHTNTIEGHWSLFKRAVKGTHVHISGKHLWKYVGEFSYRRNFRDCHSTMFYRLVLAFALPRLVEP
jgi:hypothetical protein